MNLQHAIGCTWLLSLFLLYFHRRVWLYLYYIYNQLCCFFILFLLCALCATYPRTWPTRPGDTTPKLIHLVSRCRNLSPCGIIYCSCSLRVNQNDSQVRVSGTARVAATLLTSNQQRARPIFTASPLHPFNSPLDKGNFQVSLIIHVRFWFWLFSGRWLGSLFVHFLA